MPHFILTTCALVETGPTSGLDTKARPITIPVVTDKDGSTSELLVTMQQIHGDTVEEVIEQVTGQVRVLCDLAAENAKTETPAS